MTPSLSEMYKTARKKMKRNESKMMFNFEDGSSGEKRATRWYGKDKRK